MKKTRNSKTAAKAQISSAGLPSSEMAARENAHVNAIIAQRNAAAELVASDNEALLREIFEDSQLKLEVVDDRAIEIRNEVERECEEQIRDAERAKDDRVAKLNHIEDLLESATDLNQLTEAIRVVLCS